VMLQLLLLVSVSINIVLIVMLIRLSRKMNKYMKFMFSDDKRDDLYQKCSECNGVSITCCSSCNVQLCSTHVHKITGSNGRQQDRCRKHSKHTKVWGLDV